MSASGLKYIAVICMVIDHAAWAFVPTGTLLGQVLHLIGRLTAPIMCFFVAEGYYHTRDKKKYLLRMAAFAVISVFPYAFFCADGDLTRTFTAFYDLGMIYTLTLGLLSVMVWNSDLDGPIRFFALVAAVCLSSLGDWPYAGVLWVFFFSVFREDPKKRDIAFVLVCLMMIGLLVYEYYDLDPALVPETVCQCGTLLALPLLRLYNGERGKYPKWFFYVFYPAHLIVLGILRALIK